jgi:dihydroflavonol-4-reductase
MKALVTGGNGLIGANILRELCRAGHSATALVRRSSDISRIAHLPIDLAYGDVMDAESLAAALPGHDVVFHTAVHFTYWGHSSEAMHSHATQGSCNVLRAAHKAKATRVVMTSSTVTLGATLEPVARDETALMEDSSNQPVYVQAKVAQEHAALATAQQLGVDLVLALPAMSVGPHSTTLGPSNAVITTFLADPLRLTYAGGCNIVAVEDVARGHILLAEKGQPGERYVLGSENLDWPQIHSSIAELCGLRAPSGLASSSLCYTLALAEELRARLQNDVPATTREQARMVGRYYWYSHAKAAALGYAPQPARCALATAIAWLAASPHVSRETRCGLRLSREVYDARRATAASESIFVRRAA